MTTAIFPSIDACANHRKSFKYEFHVRDEYKLLIVPKEKKKTLYLLQSCIQYVMVGFYCWICVLIQCVDEGQGSGEESAFTSPRLLSGSEMKALLQWEESESHPLPTLEKQITVHIQSFLQSQG